MTMMGCGHASNAVSAGEPVCVICVGIVPGAREVVAGPDLTGREAHCSYHTPGRYGRGAVERDGRHAWTPSRDSLAFFEYRPDAATDLYYCGCFGWD